MEAHRAGVPAGTPAVTGQPEGRFPVPARPLQTSRRKRSLSYTSPLGQRQ